MAPSLFGCISTVHLARQSEDTRENHHHHTPTQTVRLPNNASLGQEVPLEHSKCPGRVVTVFRTPI